MLTAGILLKEAALNGTSKIKRMEVGAYFKLKYLTISESLYCYLVLFRVTRCGMQQIKRYLILLIFRFTLTSAV